MPDYCQLHFTSKACESVSMNVVRPQVPSMSVEQTQALECHANTWQMLFVTYIMFSVVLCGTHAFMGA